MSDSNFKTDASGCGCPGRLPAATSRREFLQNASMGFGWLALSSMLGERGQNAFATAPQSPVSKAFIAPHIPPRAKHVIFLFMDGGVSHVDSFDPKPKLTADHGKQVTFDHPETRNRPGYEKLFLKKPDWRFAPRGKSGIEHGLNFGEQASGDVFDLHSIGLDDAEVLEPAHGCLGLELAGGGVLGIGLEQRLVGEESGPILAAIGLRAGGGQRSFESSATLAGTGPGAVANGGGSG